MLAGAAFAAKEALSPAGLNVEARFSNRTHASMHCCHTQLTENMRTQQQAAMGSVTSWWSSRSDAPIVGAWIAAGALGISLVDYICSLPVLNLLLPAAFQALGIASVAVCALRYVNEGASPQADIDATGAKLAELLPGLEK